MKRLFLLIFAVFFVSAAIFAQYDLDRHIAVNEQPAANTFVVIVANENYKHEVAVPFALNDGQTFRVYCEKTLGVPADHIKLLKDATLNDMKHEIDWLVKIVNAYDGQARAIVYYSGHGMPDEKNRESFLLPVDGYSTDSSTGYSAQLLYDQLGGMKSSATIVLLDACFSGAQRNGSMLQMARGVAIVPKGGALSGQTVVFAASQNNETAYPYTDKKHGLFTYYILERLHEKGGCVSMGELSDYVTQQVKRQSLIKNSKAQTPAVAASASAPHWRNWMFAEKAATKFQVLPNTEPTDPTHPDGVQPKQQPVKQAPLPQEPETKPQNNQKEQSVTLADTNETLDLVARGRRAVRELKYPLAKKYFLMAIDKGSLEAQCQMGLLYMNRNYDDYNKDQALYYFEKASKAGHVEAAYQAGMVWLGTDNAVARRYFRQAASKGHKAAKTQLEKLR